MARKKTTTPPRNSSTKDAGEVIDLDNPEFQKAWELLQFTSRSVFLTGKAGTGKSTFLRYITSNTRKSYVVLAPTGIAAVNVGGQTLHSFFRIPFKPITPDDPDFARDRLKQRMKYPASLIKLLRKVELIIIDEISMVRADTIDFVDKILRFYNHNDRRPFGGKQLLLVGDVFQLEPVVTGDMRDILRPYYKTLYFFGANAFGNMRIVPIELRKVYRQSDSEFIGILDRIRAGIASPADLSTLNSRVTSRMQLSPTSDSFTMTLATRRDMVDYINRTHLDAIKRPLVTFMGKIKGEFPENALPTDMELSLKEGAQVVFIKNDPEHRWVNGTVGIISTLAADTVEVTLESGETHVVLPEVWGNIKYTFNPSTKEIVEEELGSFTQLPVKLAWALTIHKSQGLTFSRAIVDLGHGAFAGGQTYVALSRCRSLQGISLMSTIADRDIFVNPAVTEFARSFNDQQIIDEALEQSHADSCYEKALKLADKGFLSEAFDMFTEGMRYKSILDNKSYMRLARRKLTVVKHQFEEINRLKAKIKADSERFADIAREYLSLGDDCLQDDMPLPAIANYDKALALSPDLMTALSHRARAYCMLSQWADAVSDYRSVFDSDPTDLRIVVEMSRCHYNMGDLHNAMDRAMVGLNLMEENEYPRRLQADLHDILADIYNDMGDSDLADSHRKIADRLRR